MTSPKFTTQPWWVTQRKVLLTALAVVAILVIGILTLGRSGNAGAPGAAKGGSEGGGTGAGAPPAMPPMPVDVDTARVRPIVDAVRATGRIEAVQAVELRSDEQGRVTALLFREGQIVSRGASLVRIDDAMLRAQAERADADRDLAQQQLARVRRLRVQAGGILHLLGGDGGTRGAVECRFFCWRRRGHGAESRHHHCLFSRRRSKRVPTVLPSAGVRMAGALAEEQLQVSRVAFSRSEAAIRNLHRGPSPVCADAIGEAVVPGVD